jgi:hypothetical protein
MHPDRQFPTAANRNEVDYFTFGERAVRAMNEENIGKATEREDHIVFRYVEAVGLVQYLVGYMETG